MIHDEIVSTAAGRFRTYGITALTDTPTEHPVHGVHLPEVIMCPFTATGRQTQAPETIQALRASPKPDDQLIIMPHYIPMHFVLSTIIRTADESCEVICVDSYRNEVPDAAEDKAAFDYYEQYNCLRKYIAFYIKRCWPEVKYIRHSHSRKFPKQGRDHHCGIHAIQNTATIIEMWNRHHSAERLVQDLLSPLESSMTIPHLRRHLYQLYYAHAPCAVTERQLRARQPPTYPPLHLPYGSYNRQYTLGDGNCFYESLAVLLMTKLPQEHHITTHQQARANIYNTIQSQMTNSPTDELRAGCDSLQVELAEHKKLTVYAEDLQIQQAANIYNVHIHIHRYSSPPHYMVQKFEPNNRPWEVRPILDMEHCVYGYINRDAHVHYITFNHFMPLFPIDLDDPQQGPVQPHTEIDPNNVITHSSFHQVGEYSQIIKFAHENAGIKQSGIPGAGNGLYAMSDVISGDTICTVYVGEVIKGMKNIQKSTSMYLITNPLYRDTAIDAQAIDSCHGRFMNDPMDDSKVNVKWKAVRGRQDIIHIVSLWKRKILRDTEYFISYKGGFWAQPCHPLEVRKIAAEAYKEHRLHILSADGEGECDHVTCINIRRKHIQTHLDKYRNCATIPPPEIQCRRRPLGLTNSRPDLIDNHREKDGLAAHDQTTLNRLEVATQEEQTVNTKRQSGDDVERRTTATASPTHQPASIFDIFSRNNDNSAISIRPTQKTRKKPGSKKPTETSRTQPTIRQYVSQRPGGPT